MEYDSLTRPHTEPLFDALAQWSLYACSNLEGIPVRAWPSKAAYIELHVA